MSDFSILKQVQEACSSLNMLYVEDDTILSEATMKTLRAFFQSVTLANDGKEGLELYKNNHYDIVLSDILMPHMDGKEMSREIRKINPDQAIIIMSAHEEAEFLMELIEIGIDKFVQKPPDIKRLAQAILATAHNINNAKKVAELVNLTRQDLAESRELLRTIIDTVPVRIFWKDLDSNYLGCNRLFANDAGLKDQSELIGKTDFQLPWKREAQSYVDDDRYVITSGKEKISYDEEQTHEDGSRIWVTTSKTPLRNEDDEIIGILGAYVDVTAQKEAMVAVQKARDELGYQAEHDTLTGLPNRTLYFDRLHQAINKSSRNGTKTAVIFIDLDRFKEINDSLGHETGDNVVKSLAKRLSSQLRQIDTIARFGGDEFIILIESFADMQDVQEVLNKLMDSMKEPFDINGHKLLLTMSAGVSIYPDDGDDAEVLIRNADTAMYRAKDDGRNTSHFYTKELTKQSFAHMVMSKNIRDALEAKEFVVYYQPQIDGRNKQLIGMEALIRWISPSEGFISPAEFIPIAEDYGLIDQLGRYVFLESVSQITRWYQQGLNPGRISINLSTIELQQKEFVDSIKTCLEEHKCNPDWIELEITEGYTMKHPDTAIEMLQELRDLGIHLSIDDFGTGYSSLSYLKRLPIHKLKIDQTFVQDLPNNVHDIAIVESIISMAQAMKFDVIAEGVETLAQHEFLVDKGCDNIQGYYYAKPMPAEEMEEFIKNFPNI